MAKRDTSLDKKIEDAARSEFLRLGYEKASLHEIARIAGVTTGALYTRYEGKDGLFESLLKELFDEVASYETKASELYIEAEKRMNVDMIVGAIRKETEIYQDLLFRRYDACKLLVCRSHGSRVGRMLSDMFEVKSRETATYFQRLAGHPIDTDSLAIILQSQFEQFRCILERDWPRDKAVEALKVSEIYQEAGWRALFQSIMEK